MKKITLLLMLLTVSFGYSQALHTIDFEPAGVGSGWSWTAADIAPSFSEIANPVSSGINTSATVVEFIAYTTDFNWTLCHTSDDGEFTFDGTNSTLKMMVYKPTLSRVTIKVEGAGPPTELNSANTVINEWEELTFDASALIGQSYNKIVIIPDFVEPYVNGKDRTTDNTLYFDNIQVPDGEVVVAPVGPVTMTVSHSTAAGMRMTGPWWGWAATGGPMATDNGDGTFSVVMFDGVDQENFEYLWVETNAAGDATAGAGQENLVDNAAGGTCTDRIDAGNMVTDYANWANRVFTTGPTTWNETYDDCLQGTSLSVKDYEIEGLTAYPNPTTDSWRITTLNEEIRSVEVFNMLGKSVLIVAPNDRVVNINAESLATGIYITKISTDSGFSTRKLIKK